MVRTYKQKNSYLPNSKHSDSAFVDILRCYIQGVSTGEAAAIVTENNRLRGEKSVSRQAIQSLYKQSGELLGSSHITGERGSDLQKEVVGVAVTVGHSLDDLYPVVHTFQHTGV